MLRLLVSVRFQVLFHSPPGVLFTFPSRYYSAIGHQVVFSLGGWSPLLPTRFHVPCGTLVPAARSSLSLTGLLPSLVPLSNGLRLDTFDGLRRPSTPDVRRLPVWALPRSLAATKRIVLTFFSSGYLDVSVHRVPSVYLWIQYTVTEVCSAGFPHSDICGSMDICSSPQLFAAYHVFHRLLVPRHPPCALYSLTCRIVLLFSSGLFCIALLCRPGCS